MYPDKDGYRISTDPSELDLGVVHCYLKESYWAAGVPEGVVRRSIEASLCFGIYRGEEQVGFARVITDRATFAYLADVFVLEEHRGRGIGKWLVEAVLSHPDCKACGVGCSPPGTRTTSTGDTGSQSSGGPRSSWRERTLPTVSERRSATLPCLRRLRSSQPCLRIVVQGIGQDCLSREDRDAWTGVDREHMCIIA
jgi:GNAT superfamily N-acetyltransferase